jgi:titin
LAPQHLLALGTGANEITLAWTAGSSNELGYLIERSSDGINFAAQLSAAVDARSAVDSGLLANVTYYYRVRATNTVGSSEYSDIASATTVQATSAPAAPAALAAAAQSGNEYYRARCCCAGRIARATKQASRSNGRPTERALCRWPPWEPT